MCAKDTFDKYICVTSTWPPDKCSHRWGALLRFVDVNGNEEAMTQEVDKILLIYILC